MVRYTLTVPPASSIWSFFALSQKLTKSLGAKALPLYKEIVTSGSPASSDTVETAS